MYDTGEHAVRSQETDAGLQVVDFVYKHMSIDDEWSVREGRGFTWWGDWVRQRVWADEAVESNGDTLWHVRARTPVYRDLPDEPETYALVQEMNVLTSFSAYVYDPDDGTVSARCGAFVYEAIAPWLEKYVLAAAGLQSSFAWSQGPAQADGRSLDDQEHPSSGRPAEPDDMLSAAVTWTPMPFPITAAALERAASAFVAEGLVAAAEPNGEGIKVLVPPGTQDPALWTLGPVVHPVLGPGAGIRLTLRGEFSIRQGAWLANALNLAESSDWHGEDRPHALGAWCLDGRLLRHDTFVPASVLGELTEEGALIALRNFVGSGAMRTKSAHERLPWLMTAAASRYPDDELAEPPQETDEEAPFVPYEKRSFGPAARTQRARPATAIHHEPVELIVDPADASAYAEIDSAVAAAEDGDTIIVRPGTYRTPAVVDRAVAIRGEGPRHTILLEPVGGEAIGFAASGASVKGLTIRPAQVGNDGATHSAVAVHNAQVSVDDCDLSSHLGATVWIGGPSSRALFKDCAIHDGAQNAIWVTEEGRAEVESCRISGHRWPVIVGGPHASMVLRATEVLDNYDHGIAAMEGATLTVDGCTSSRNAGNGVWLAEATPATRIVASTMQSNGGTGVFIERSGGQVTGNHIADNGVGIAVVGMAAPTLEDNVVSGNGIGLGVRGSDAAPRVIGNTIDGSSRDGIVIDEAAAGRFESNAITHSGRAGVWVSDNGSRPRFTNNTVSGGSLGVLVSGGGGGEFRSNDLRGNVHGSWHLDGPGDLAREDNLEDSGKARLDENEPGSDAHGSPAPSSRLN